MFTNRKDAGKKLAEKLKSIGGNQVLVLAIPRGGVPVGYEIAKELNAEFSLLITRKLPFPDHPEAGFGAVAEDGSTVILREASANISRDVINTIIKSQTEEIQRRIKILRGGCPLPPFEKRTIILVDDGIAMGSTMRASIKMCAKRNPNQLIVAAPVASPEITRALKIMDDVDETIILENPRFFYAVAQVYEDWYDVPDHEVINIMKEREQTQ